MESIIFRGYVSFRDLEFVFFGGVFFKKHCKDFLGS